MKLTTAIVFLRDAAGSAWGQNPDVIDNTRSTLKAVQQQKTMTENAALSGPQGQSAKPSTPREAQCRRAPGKASVTRVCQRNQTGSDGQGCSSQSGRSKATPCRTKPRPKPSCQRKQQPQAENCGGRQEEAGVRKRRKLKTINLTGRRDPFVSPVVESQHAGFGVQHRARRCLASSRSISKVWCKSEPE